MYVCELAEQSVFFCIDAMHLILIMLTKLFNYHHNTLHCIFKCMSLENTFFYTYLKANVSLEHHRTGSITLVLHTERHGRDDAVRQLRHLRMRTTSHRLERTLRDAAQNMLQSYREERMDQVCLDGGERLSLHQHRECFVFFRGHQVAEPRALRQLRRRVGRQMHLIRGDFKRDVCRIINAEYRIRICSFIYTLQFPAMKARAAQKTIFDVGQSRLPQLAAGLAARGAGHGRRRYGHVVRRTGRCHYCNRNQSKLFRMC